MPERPILFVIWWRPVKVVFVLYVMMLAVLIGAAIVCPIASAVNDNVTLVTTPFITIDPIGNHTIGDVFFINGTTNLPVSEKLTIHAYPLASIRGGKGRLSPGIYADEIPIVSGIKGVNHWSVNVTGGYWEPEEFVVGIWATKFIPKDKIIQFFTILETDNITPIQDTNVISTKYQPHQTNTSTIPVTPISRAASLPPILVPFAIITGIVFLKMFNDVKMR